MNSPRSRAVGAFLLDVVLVIAFAATGRAQHDENLWSGLATTAWPFLVGLGVGWVVTLGWRAPTAPVRTGLGVWAATIIGGMLLRAASGQGIAISFIIVASIVLFVALFGWRIVAALIGRRRR